VLGCGREVNAASAAGTDGGLPPSSWSSAPAAVAAKLKLCPSSRRAADTVLAEKLAASPTERGGATVEAEPWMLAEHRAVGAGTDVLVGFVADVYCPYTKSVAPNAVCLLADGQ
jgi:hypothetical protein